MPVTILQHPIAKLQLRVLRDETTPSALFRDTLQKMSSLIVLEASKDLPLIEVPKLQSPFGPFTGHALPGKIGLVPILRSGLGMEHAALSLLPDAKVYHIGLFREQASLEPVEYYSRLPSTLTVDTIYILDPLLATGNTAIAAICMIQEWGFDVRDVKLLAILASKIAIKNILSQFPDMEIVVTAVDEELSDRGYVIPGCGDVGDRLYNSR